LKVLLYAVYCIYGQFVLAPVLIDLEPTAGMHYTGTVCTRPQLVQNTHCCIMY